MDIDKFLRLVIGKRVDSSMSIMVSQPSYMRMLGTILNSLDEQYVCHYSLLLYFDCVFSKQSFSMHVRVCLLWTVEWYKTTLCGVVWACTCHSCPSSWRSCGSSSIWTCLALRLLRSGRSASLAQMLLSRWLLHSYLPRSSETLLTILM